MTRPVRLRDHERDLVAGIVKGLQRGHGKGGRAGENDLQEGEA
jgi:hypothetical protein